LYEDEGTAKPPFPALGELDDQDSHDYADLLVATAEGVISGISSEGEPITNLGFPYTLPSSTQGGFAVIVGYSELPVHRNGFP